MKSIKQYFNKFNFSKYKTLALAGVIFGTTSCKLISEPFFEKHFNDTEFSLTHKDTVPYSIQPTKVQPHTNNIKIDTFNLSSNYDSLNISIITSYPTEKPLAVVQLVHGMCGCKERFLPVMEYLSNNGIVCVASDLRGHGQSIKDTADLGYFYSGGYKALVDDIRIVTNWAQHQYPETPVFLIGHSMGSLAVRIYTKQDDSALSGLIVCGSPSKNPLSGIGKSLAKTACSSGDDKRRFENLQKITDNFYNKKFASEGPKAWTCSDPESRKTFMENPRCNFSFTVNGTYNLMEMMEETYNLKGWKVSNPNMPILFISGSDDPCMISEKKFQEAIQTMQKVGYNDVNYTIYPKMRHEVLNEINKQAVWNEILTFVKTR